MQAVFQCMRAGFWWLQAGFQCMWAGFRWLQAGFLWLRAEFLWLRDGFQALQPVSVIVKFAENGSGRVVGNDRFMHHLLTIVCNFWQFLPGYCSDTLWLSSCCAFPRMPLSLLPFRCFHSNVLSLAYLNLIDLDCTSNTMTHFCVEALLSTLK